MRIEHEKPGSISRRFFLRTALIAGAGAVAFQGDTVQQLIAAGIHSAEFPQFLQYEREMPKFPGLVPYSVLFGISAETKWYERVEEREQLYGHRPEMSNYFLYGYDNFPHEVRQEIINIHDHGILPVISWGEANIDFGTKNDDLRKMARLARSLKSFAFPLIFRPYYEMNGPWTKEWYYIQSPEHFVQGWRSMYDVFQNEGAHNILFCFSPNAWTDPGIIQFEPFFPGDTFIDISSFDVYNHINLPPRIAVGHDIAVLQRVSKKKYGISECGSKRRYGNGEWMKEMMRYTAATGCSFFMPYDRDEREKEGVDWRVSSDPELRVVVPQELKQWYYSVNNPIPIEDTHQRTRMLTAA